MAFRIRRNINVETYDVACVYGLLVDDLVRIVCDTYLIGIVERVEINV